MLDFLIPALIAAGLISIACGLIGSFVTVQRIEYLAGGIAHSVLAGMGGAVFFGFSILNGALLSALLAALFIGWIRLYHPDQQDTLISATWSIGMSIGLLFIQASPGYQSDLMDYLFGNILLVSESQLNQTLWLDMILSGLTLLFYRPLQAIAFDMEFARLRGLPSAFFYLLLLGLIGLTVVLLLQLVGLILLIALLSLPAAIAGQYTDTLAHRMILAILISAILSSSGILLSYYWDQPTAPIIILLTGTVYLMSTIGSYYRERF